MIGRSEKLQGRWSVISTIRAPLPQIEQFVHHYVSLGAERLYLFFDDLESFRHYDQVDSGIVEPAYDDPTDASGEAIGLSPRQMANFEKARGRAGTRWLLHVDGDEFIFARRRVSQVLQEFDNSTYSVVLRPMEAVYRQEPKSEEILTNPWFRRRVNDEQLLESIYGELAPLTKSGLFGHIVGKCFVRTELPIKRHSVHSPRPEEQGMKVGVETADLDLLHFDAMTFDDWRAKFALRLGGKVSVSMSQLRQRQLELIRQAYDADDRSMLRALYNRMHVFAEDRFNPALAAGFIVERNCQVPHPASAC